MNYMFLIMFNIIFFSIYIRCDKWSAILDVRSINTTLSNARVFQKYCNLFEIVLLKMSLDFVIFIVPISNKWRIIKVKLYSLRVVGLFVWLFNPRVSWVTMKFNTQTFNITDTTRFQSLLFSVIDVVLNTFFFITIKFIQTCIGFFILYK